MTHDIITYDQTTHKAAMFNAVFWYPMVSIATIAPLMSSKTGSSGVTVISLLFSYVFICPKTRSLSLHHPLTIWTTLFPDSSSPVPPHRLFICVHIGKAVPKIKSQPLKANCLPLAKVIYNKCRNFNNWTGKYSWKSVEYSIS